MYLVTETNKPKPETFMCNTFEEATDCAKDWCDTPGMTVVIYDMVKVASVECPIVVKVTPDHACLTTLDEASDYNIEEANAFLDNLDAVGKAMDEQAVRAEGRMVAGPGFPETRKGQTNGGS